MEGTHYTTEDWSEFLGVSQHPLRNKRLQREGTFGCPVLPGVRGAAAHAARLPAPACRAECDDAGFGCLAYEYNAADHQCEQYFAEDIEAAHHPSGPPCSVTDCFSKQFEYEQQQGNVCAPSDTLGYIESPRACTAAAFDLGLITEGEACTVEEPTMVCNGVLIGVDDASSLPYGCYWRNDKIWFNPDPTAKTRTVSDDTTRQSVCRKLPSSTTTTVATEVCEDQYVAFILDASASMCNENVCDGLQSQLQYAAQVVLAAHDKVHFSFFRFSTTAYNPITYAEADAMTRAELAAAVLDLNVTFEARTPLWTTIGRVSAVHTAIWTLLMEGNTGDAGFEALRPTVVMFTDGDASSKDELMYSAKYMHGSGRRPRAPLGSPCALLTCITLCRRFST